MGKAVIVSGYPGTGKTAVANELRTMLGKDENLIEADEVARTKELFLAYDAKRGSHVYDIEYLEKLMKEEVERWSGITFIFSLVPCILPKDLVVSVFVLRAGSEEVARRLKDRGWSDEKIEENLEAMDMWEIEEEASECYGKEKLRSLDTTGKTPREVATLILKEIRDYYQKQI